MSNETLSGLGEGLENFHIDETTAKQETSEQKASKDILRDTAMALIQPGFDYEHSVLNGTDYKSSIRRDAIKAVRENGDGEFILALTHSIDEALSGKAFDPTMYSEVVRLVQAESKPEQVHQKRMAYAQRETTTLPWPRRKTLMDCLEQPFTNSGLVSPLQWETMLGTRDLAEQLPNKPVQAQPERRPLWQRLTRRNK